MSTIIQVLETVAIALFGGSYNNGTNVVDVQGAIPMFWDWLTDPAVLPFFVIGMAVALLLLAVRVVKGIFWGV